MMSVANESQSKFVDISVPAWGWVALLAVIVSMLLFDILVLHRRAHVIHTNEATIESAALAGICLSFTLVLWGAFE